MLKEVGSESMVVPLRAEIDRSIGPTVDIAPLAALAQG